MKQVPLVFVIMSRKKKGDYKAVLRNLVSALPFQPAVNKVTLDFESSVGGFSRPVSRRHPEGLPFPLDTGSVEKGKKPQMMKNLTHKHRLHFLLMFEYDLPVIA